MTEQELEEITNRCEAATAGPWTYVGHELYYGPQRSARHQQIGAEVDAAFIAHARTDLPALIESLHSAHREIHECWQKIDDARGVIDYLNHEIVRLNRELIESVNQERDGER